MKFPDIRSFLTELETSGELVRSTAELSPRYEAASAIKMIAQKQGKAVLLDKVKGYDIPVVGNILGSRRRLALAFDVTEGELPATYLEGRNKPIKPHLIARGPVQDVIVDSGIDIPGTIPVLTHHQRDAGPYITCGFVVAKDPVTGVRGLGIHRIQVKAKDTVGILLASPPLSDFLAKAEEQNKPLEIAVVIGADPLMYFTSPQSAAAEIDKYDIAGGLARSPIKLVKCKSVDIEVPAYAEFVLEGYIIPRLREDEGPFGESTGYYLTYKSPVAIIKAITHRRNPIYHALVPFGSEEKVLQFPRFQIDTLVWLQDVVPAVRQVYCPAFGVVYVQIEKHADEDVAAVINALFFSSGIPYSKIVVVVDTDVDVLNPDEISWALATRVRPEKDLTIKTDLPGFIIDPSALGSDEFEKSSLPRTRTAKLGIDATKPQVEWDKYEKIDVPLEVKRKVARILGIQDKNT